MTSSLMLLLLILSAGGTRAISCPDGTAGLTKKLYADSLVTVQGSATYANVTCIPADEFNAYSGDVTLNGLQHLTSIEEKAFFGFKGKLVVKGEYPSLQEIADLAFMTVNSHRNQNQVSTSEVLFELGLPALVTIGSQAFRSFTGTVSFAGAFPLLKSIGNTAFDDTGRGKGTNSKIDFGAG